jgi:Domain of unknown function (DUF397)
MPVPDLSRAAWRKSSYSNGSGGSCVEVATTPIKSTRLGGQTGTEPAALGDEADGGTHIVAVRDSKDRQGPVLAFGPDEWRAFATGVKAGEFDLH